MRRLAHALVALAVVGAVLVGLRVRSQRASSEPKTEPNDHLFLLTQPGLVRGHISMGGRYVVTVERGGVEKARATGQADSSGGFTANVRYDDGTSVGAHNGDLVRLVDEVSHRTWSAPVRLTGFLDESTGRMDGTTNPRSTVEATLYTNGDRAHRVARVSTVTGADGRFSFNFATAVVTRPRSASDGWRGYQADVTIRRSGTALFRFIQTPNSTLVWTRDQAGGGYFIPGDHVTHELVRRGTVVGRADATANEDGIPRGYFEVHVEAGDVFRTRYHNEAGGEATLEEQPWALIAHVDVARGTVSGQTAPNAPVRAVVHRPDNTEALLGARAGADGSFAIHSPTPLEGGRLISVWRVADPSFRGVSVQQIDLHAPTVRVEYPSGLLTGWGPVGEGPLRAVIYRGGALLTSATGTVARNGALKVQLPGRLEGHDAVTLTGPGGGLPPISIGPEPQVDELVGQGPNLKGTARPQAHLRILAGDCSGASDVDAVGHWESSLSCRPALGAVVTIESVVAGGEVPGSAVLWTGMIGQPLVHLTVGAPSGAGFRVSVTITNGVPGATTRVDVQVDGSTAVVLAGPPWEGLVNLGPGLHAVRAVVHAATPQGTVSVVTSAQLVERTNS